MEKKLIQKMKGFSCACQTEKDRIIHQGRLYITQKHLCFHSHVLLFGQPYIVFLFFLYYYNHLTIIIYLIN